jgi:hypothetical protein
VSAANGSRVDSGTTPRPSDDRDSAVKVDFTAKRRSKRPRKDVETMDYLGAARRFIRAAGRRVADCDEVELAELIALRLVVEAAIDEAVSGQKVRKSWAGIALATGTTREAAYQRWGRKK